MVRAEGLVMPYFLLAAAGFVLAMMIVGLARIFRGPGNADRMMAAQLFGTGGIAGLLLLAAARGIPAAVDVSLTLALLTAFASVAFVRYASRPDAEDPGRKEGGGALRSMSSR
jgi:multicomponent Na+:H+ antiporter subunit F